MNFIQEVINIKVYQIRLKVFLINSINAIDIQMSICSFIDEVLSKNSKLLKLHSQNTYKYYVFDQLYPIEPKQIYKKENIYTFTVRTIQPELANFFSKELQNHANKTLKGLTSEIKVLNKKHIEKIYSITPCVLKDEKGYWKDYMSLAEFEERIKINLIKKYNLFMDQKMDEDFQLFTSIELKNKVPIAISYKSIKLLGDKISASIADNRQAQDLAYMALGTGIMENNGRGSGFVNFRYL